ncbi:MAG: Hpt domain-containing protein, partial [Desulfobulbaceae bacterium]|nr:Hpt domain-containing protein [Desulfobulbaceae bacterium]
HSIKGAAASLGVDGIREITMKIETDSRSGSLIIAKEQLANLEDLLQQLQEL